MIAPTSAPATTIPVPAVPPILDGEDVMIRERPGNSGSQPATLYRPEIIAPSAPVVVMFHGFGADRNHAAGMAQASVELGVPVLNASWLADPSRPEESATDAVCAVAFAVEHAAEWGSDPERVIVMGHSGGGHVGMLAALTPESFPDCPTASSAAVWAYIGLAADPAAAASGGNARPLWEHDTALITLMNNYTHIGGNPDLIVRFIHGETDNLVPIEQTAAFHDELVAAGYSSFLTPIPDADHSDPIIPSTDAGTAALNDLSSLIALATIQP